MASSSPDAGAAPTEVDPATMKVAQLKEELRKLGVRDLSHCVEKSDLVAELVKARARAEEQKAAAGSGAGSGYDIDDGGLSYGPVQAVGNTTNPTGLVVFLHGLGDTCHGWSDSVPQIIGSELKHLLFVLPTAAAQKVTLNMGAKMPAWYDIKSLNAQGPEDTDGMRRSAQKMDSIVAEYSSKYGIPQDRCVYAGFSQGACVSFFTGLTTPRGTPAGIAALSGYVGGREWVLEHLKHRDVPVFMAHGTQDPVINIQWSALSRQALEQVAKVSNVAYHTYEMGHSAHPQELLDLRQFLKKVLPPS